MSRYTGGLIGASEEVPVEMPVQVPVMEPETFTSGGASGGSSAGTSGGAGLSIRRVLVTKWVCSVEQVPVSNLKKKN